MNHMKKCLPDLIIGLALLLFLVTLNLQIAVIPKDSKTYPVILMILSYIMAAALTVKSLIGWKSAPVVESRLKKQLKIILPYAAMILAYLFLLDQIGYIIDTFLFSMLSLIWLKLKNKAVILIVSAVLTLALYFLFTRFLSVILPRGSLLTLTL